MNFAIVSRDEWVIDTCILQKANAPVTQKPKPTSEFARRVRLLEQLSQGYALLLYSPTLVREYNKNIPTPRNDFVKAFLEMLTSPGKAVMNWHKPWGGATRDTVKSCRYPRHDHHLLRTAIRPAGGSIIYSEDGEVLRSNVCIYKHFRVRIAGI